MNSRIKLKIGQQVYYPIKSIIDYRDGKPVHEYRISDAERVVSFDDDTACLTYGPYTHFVDRGLITDSREAAGDAAGSWKSRDASPT
jgi:hypothetical protein